MDKFLKLKLKRAYIIALFEKEKLDEALSAFEKYKQECACLKFLKGIAKEIKTTNAAVVEKLQGIAQKNYKEENYDIVLKCYESIFLIDSNNVKNLSDYITALEKVKQYDLALSITKKLLEVEKTPNNYKTLARIYGLNQEYYKAIDAYETSVKLLNKRKKDGGDYNTLGCHYFNAYVKGGENPKDAQSSLDCYLAALKTEPDSKIYLKNTIIAAMKTKNYEIEKKCWDDFMKLGKMSKDDEFTYSASCMRNGDIKGWAKYYGSRFEKNNPCVFPKINKPLWTGKEDISNKTLLVHSEQGFGDNFLMWGYIPRLKGKAKKIIYVSQDSIVDLLKQSNFGVEVVGNKDAKLDKRHFDYYLPCMSLPIVLNLNKDNISPKGGYIKAPQDRIEEYREKYFNNKKFKVGFGFLGVKSNQKRDIPFDKLLLLDKLKDVQLYCLTKDVPDEQLKRFKHNKVINIASKFEDFSDTAAAIENCDIIVSSDNCILNLAGAMGKRTLGVFNYHYEFRWYDLSGEDCGWFTSVKPIVNNEYNDWDISLKRVVEEINKIKNNV